MKVPALSEGVFEGMRWAVSGDQWGGNWWSCNRSVGERWGGGREVRWKPGVPGPQGT